MGKEGRGISGWDLEKCCLQYNLVSYTNSTVVTPRCQLTNQVLYNHSPGHCSTQRSPAARRAFGLGTTRNRLGS